MVLIKTVLEQGQETYLPVKFTHHLQGRPPRKIPTPLERDREGQARPLLQTKFLFNIIYIMLSYRY